MKHDPLGYYAILELQPGASEQDIKISYRRRAMALHPDRNQDRDTTEQFKALNEAFEVLSDCIARAAYDSHSAPEAASEQRDGPPPEPVICSSCGKVSAQPRLAVYRSVKSLLLVTLRKPIAGVFCSECAHKKSLMASATTWLLGWWGFPWGPVYTVQALLHNMFGGTQPPLENTRLLAYQAYCFYTMGRREIAFAIAEDALKFCERIRPTSRQTALMNERDDLAKRLKAFLDAERRGGSSVKLKSSWRFTNKLFPVHLGAIAVAGFAIALAVVNVSSHRSPPPKGPMPYSPQPIAADAPKTLPAQVKAQQVAQHPVYVRPTNAPNGKPWPVTAGYLKAVPLARTAGHSEVTVDNSQNSSDVFVKLVSLSGNVARPARQIFIPAHGKFTMKSLEQGPYDVRYQDLHSGGRSRSEAMTLTETASSVGIEYSTITLTLYKVRNGNMATYDLPAEEF